MFKTLSENVGTSTSDENYIRDIILNNIKTNNKISGEIITELLKLKQKDKQYRLKLEEQLKKLSEDKLLNTNLMKENLILKNNISEIKEDLISVKEINNNLLSNEANKIEEKETLLRSEYEDKLAKLRCKIEELENTNTELIENNKIEEIEFNCNLQTAKSKADKRYHDMECALKDLLKESDKKLKEAEISNNTLREALFKSKQSNNEDALREKIYALEDELLFTNNQLRIAQESLYEKRSSGCTKFTSKNYGGNNRHFRNIENQWGKTSTSTSNVVYSTPTSIKLPSSDSSPRLNVISSVPKTVQQPIISREIRKIPFPSCNLGYDSSEDEDINFPLNNKKSFDHSKNNDISNLNVEIAGSSNTNINKQQLQDRKNRNENVMQHFRPLQISNKQNSNILRNNEYRFETPVKEPMKRINSKKKTDDKSVIPNLKFLSFEASDEEKKDRKKRKLYSHDDVYNVGNN